MMLSGTTSERLTGEGRAAKATNMHRNGGAMLRVLDFSVAFNHNVISNILRKFKNNLWVLHGAASTPIGIHTSTGILSGPASRLLFEQGAACMIFEFPHSWTA